MSSSEYYPYPANAKLSGGSGVLHVTMNLPKLQILKVPPAYCHPLK
jgi:hypothetical protein